MVNWLKMLNPKSQRDAERAFWAVMLLPEFARLVCWRLGRPGETISKQGIIDSAQSAAHRVSSENFNTNGSFFSKVELANAAVNLDFSTRMIAGIFCDALDKGTVDPNSSSTIYELAQEIFSEYAIKAIEGARIGHLKYNEGGISHIVSAQQINLKLLKSK
jgi:hypothetical protein